MTQERFEDLIDKFEGNRAEVLKAKNAKYAPCDDALHNFHTGARLDGSTTCQTIWHYMKKHFVALLDKIERDDWRDIDDVFEKMGDIMNYMDFMWCAANEEYEKYTKNTTGATMDYDIVPEEYGCYNCKHNHIELDDNGKANEGPCKNCKNNFLQCEDEYNTAPFNWEEEE